MTSAPASWALPPLPPRFEHSRNLLLVGRGRELETLERLWPEVEAGRRQVLFVGGEPGAGKTRLMAEAAGALHDSGVAVLVGTSTREAGVPYQPFADMLDVLFAAAPRGALASAVGTGGPELRRLSSEVERHAAADERTGPAGDMRRHLFEAVVRLFRALATDRPLAVILDDLHWAQVPTLALLEYVVEACADARLLVMATFRTTAPDRSDEVMARVAELHRLEGVRRIDLGGLDTDAIAEYISLRTGLPVGDLRSPAALLRDRTGGNPFFLRELWADLERQGGVSALRHPQRVPASIGDTLAARVAGLGEEVRRLIETAAVIGDSFAVGTLVAASETEPAATLALLDSAIAVGLVEAGPGGQDFSFVHALTRQAVVDRMPPSRRALLHARVAEALEGQPLRASLVPRLAEHYLAAQVLGFQARALRYCRKAGRLAERSLAFEEAAGWFEKAASLPECDLTVQAELLLAAAGDYVLAGRFPRARDLYESLVSASEPGVRLAAAMGYEDATWRPGVTGTHAADLLAEALEVCPLAPDDPLYARARGSFGRALALAGETSRGRQVGAEAIDAARATGDAPVLSHALVTSLWHGTAPEVSELQLARSREVVRMSRERRDFATLGMAANFRAMVSYIRGLPAELEEAMADSERAADMTGQPYYRHVYRCVAHTLAFIRGDFHRAEQWTDQLMRDALGDDMAEGPQGTQMYMINRERGTLGRFRPYLDGSEPLTGRWVPGLLALYTELGIEAGMRRTLQHLLERDLGAHTDGAQWPMELVFMAEAAVALGDRGAVERLLPHLGLYEGMNIVSGTLIAAFGSGDRYLACAAALRGDDTGAERLFRSALAMDRRMRSTIHLADSLARYAAFLSARGRTAEALARADEARSLAEATGQGRVLALLDAAGDRDRGDKGRPDGLSDREVDVLRLLAAGLSNAEIAARLFISANTAANHVRSILQKTGAANRTQAAIYATQHHLV